jgi:DUF3102 family protein
VGGVTASATPIHKANLSVLAETACSEHQLAIQAGESMLLHAIRAGEALLKARGCVEKGGWVRWLKDNFPASDRTAKQYMRIARGRELVLTSDAKTLSAAEKLVPALPRGNHQHRHTPEEEAEAREMHKGGASHQEIAERFGIAFRTAQFWVDPSLRDRRNRRLREDRRLARKVREQKLSKAVLRKAGAAMSELYANCERMQDVLAQARREATTSEARRSLAAAEEHYRSMRDQVVRAFGAADQQKKAA